jgi:hypothetical protein
MSVEQVIKLQEFIKLNPNALPKNNHAWDEADSEDIDNKYEESSEEEEFVSKKEIEIGKLEDQIRYLKLDLNNEQLRVHELTDLLKYAEKENEIISTTSKFVTDYISFMEIKPFEFDINFNNLLDYNHKIIESAKQFASIENLYENIKEYKPIDMPSKDFKPDDYKKWILAQTSKKYVQKTIYDYHIKDVEHKYTKIKTSYEDMKVSLKKLNEKMKLMKMFIVFLVVVNLVLMATRMF